MASDTNSSAAEAAPVRLAELDDRLAALGHDGVPLLVFRIPALERIAWRDGLRAARTIERRASAAFTRAVARVLRDDDLLAHDRGSDAFVAALVAPTRDGTRALAPLDVRAALARIATTIEGLARLDVEAGWTRYDPGSGELGAAVNRALVRGAQERERYAFFSAVGHELRTPLSSIRGYLETLLADDVDEATRRRFVGIAYNESLRLTRLLEGMFEISLLDLPTTFATDASGSLDVALAAVADACAASATRRGVRLTLPTIPPTPVAVDGDRLALVLVNVVDNAVKHGRAAGQVQLTVDTHHPRAVVVVVDDDGPGVPALQRERIFALGERGASGADGSGIGLALARMILERAGGRIEAGDAPLGGARFTITLPRREER